MLGWYGQDHIFLSEYALTAMNIFKRARISYILRRHAIGHSLWESVIKKLPLLQGMDAVEKVRLRELSTLFLHEKNLYGVKELQLTKEMRVIIAAQACLPILGLGIALLSGWSDVIVYPDVFRVNRDEMDEFGIVHHGERILSGESWSRGPVIVSWQEIERDRQRWKQGHNVIVHEIAHKLDMLNGRANGMPPLHSTMQTEQWTIAFSKAYQQLNLEVQHHLPSCMNPYAAISPAEFFAVFSEYFFCAPQVLKAHFAEVYRQLSLYYRQDPWDRINATNSLADE